MTERTEPRAPDPLAEPTLSLPQALAIAEASRLLARRSQTDRAHGQRILAELLGRRLTDRELAVLVSRHPPPVIAAFLGAIVAADGLRRQTP